MEYLFRDWADVLRRLNIAGHILLLLDYDGTLTPLVATPEQAVLAEDMRQLLRALNDRDSFSVGVISGRKLDEIQAIIGVPGIYYAGNHGLEMQGPKMHYFNPRSSQARSYLDRIYQDLEERLARLEGIILEDKNLSLSLHYRLVSQEQVQEVKEVFSRICEPYVIRNQVKITRGKKVLEVRPPVDCNKGQAVLALRDHFCAKDRLITIYIGDDQTDEDAFSVLKDSPDISILVGDGVRGSQARYFLEDVAEVKEFLARLMEL